LDGLLPPVATVKLDVEVWQLSQGVIPAEVWVADTVWGFGVTPAKAIPTFWKPWQVAQPLKMPEWFIGVAGPNPPAVVLLVEWQVSHDMPVGRWLDGFATGATPAKTWPLWQLVQPLRMPV
jgi:hypothetical protein